VQRLDLTVAEEGEKSDSFSRGGEQDRLPFVIVLIKLSLENVPVEHFQRVDIFSIVRSTP
jgi:hypothetical protein